jgi:hypothetical protein
MENLALAKRYEHYENGINTEFPYHFTMFSYKDTINTLVFLGFYISYDGEEAVLELSKDWGLFLDTYFSPYYDFSK